MTPISIARAALFIPDLPTVAETILPGYESSEWFGVVAPGRMAKPLLAKLHAEVVKETKITAD